MEQLRIIDEDDSGDNEGIIRKSLMEAEKFRLHIINEYIKYLGHTYGSLTLKKMEIIIEQLRYKLYYLDIRKQEQFFIENEKKGHKAR